MKVLLLIRSLEQGGSERQLAVLASGLARRGHGVTVVVLYGGGANEKLLAHTDVRLINLQKSSRWHVLQPLWRLWRVIRTERTDVVYAFLPTQTVIAAILTRFARGSRLVFGIRAAGMQGGHYDRLSALVYPLEARFSRFADLIVTNAEAGRLDSIKRGMRADRILVVPNGIDTDIARPDSGVRRMLRKAWSITDESFVIGMVARLDPMKDHMNFLGAAAKFMQLDENARFVCVGSGPDQYRAALLAHAGALGLEGKVIWVSAIDDARPVYNAFDIATLSSAFGEAFPNVVGEALACGVPVVATGIGDVAAIIGKCGEVVLPGNADLLCKGWVRLRERLADEPNLRGAARDRVVKHYGVDELINRTERALDQLCGGGSGG